MAVGKSRSKTASEQRVIMSHKVASRWLEKVAQPEYRMKIFAGADYDNLPNLLKLFRDGRVALNKVASISDLGVEVQSDYVSVWSKNRVALLTLRKWCEDRKLETSGIW